MWLLNLELWQTMELFDEYLSTSHRKGRRFLLVQNLRLVLLHDFLRALHLLRSNINGW